MVRDTNNSTGRQRKNEKEMQCQEFESMLGISASVRGESISRRFGNRCSRSIYVYNHSSLYTGPSYMYTARPADYEGESLGKERSRHVSKHINYGSCESVVSPSYLCSVLEGMLLFNNSLQLDKNNS